jgi:hypothetical protein
MNGKVELDIGGKIFVTAVSTLCWGSGYFQSMFGSEWKESQSSGREIFIDRGTHQILFVIQILNRMYRS